MRILLTLLIFCLSCLSPTSPRVIKQTFFANFFGNESVLTVCRFATAPGNGHYTLKIKNKLSKLSTETEGHINLNLSIYTMEDFLKAPSYKCRGEDDTFRSHNIEVPINGSEVVLGGQPLGRVHSTEVWYFVMTDCTGNYRQEFLKGNMVQYEITIKNSDGSHLSEEENGVTTVLTLALVPLTVFLIYQGFKIYNFYFNQKAIDFPVLMLTLALLLEFLAVLFEVLHLYTYTTTGRGFALLDYMNIGFAYLSRFVISILLTLMSVGWTLRPLSQDKKEAFIIIGAVVAIMVCVMAMSGKSATSDLYHFHDYQGWAGKFFIGINFVLFGLFLWQVVKNYRASDDVKVKDHYKRLGIFGGIYLLSLPLIVIYADLFTALYMRHKVILYGVIVVQSLTLVGYAVTLAAVSKNNEFYPIHYKNRAVIAAGKLI